MATFDFAISGNNVGALVSAIELSKKHHIAIINPSPNWGAHFAGFEIKDENFDIGMNFFEFTTFHKASTDLLSYNPLVRNDSARFFDLVMQFITSRIECVEVTNLEVLTENTYSEDIVMANSLTILSKLPITIREKIQHEVENILKTNPNPLHASQKKINEHLFFSKNYYEVSLANHGKTFHELFVEPFCKKIFNMSSKDCPALLHRIAWAPLFYPETILNGLNGKSSMAPTLFHYPKKGYFAYIIETLYKEIETNKNISIFRQKINTIKKTTNYHLELSTTAIEAKKLIWCNDLFSLLQANDSAMENFMPQKASVTVAFCFVKQTYLKRNFSTLYVCNMNTPIYRITNQNFAAKQTNLDKIKLVFEFNYEVLTEFNLDTDEKIISHLNNFLIQEEIINTPIEPVDVTLKTLKNAVNLPTNYNFSNFEKLFNLTQKLFPEIELVGPASGFVSTSFNDQVVQALKLGKKYN